jgi:hypothetical protein
MKNIVFYVSLLIYFFYSCFEIHSQSYCDQDSIKYLIAYNYIINDSVNQKNKIIVCDSIVDLDRYWFSEDLKYFPEEQNKLNQYRKNKNFIWSSPFYSPCLVSLFGRQNKMAEKVIFFSTIEDNMLLADLLSCTKKTDIYNYEKMASFTEGRVYLFVFCKNNTLKAAFSREMIYD